MSDRKRAIEILKQLRLDYEEFYEEHNNEVTQAYDMAISSLEIDEAYQLEYESTTKNSLAVDAISRSDVLKLMQDNWHTHNGDWAMQESMDDIRALPPVTPIRPKGHWISHGKHCKNLGVIPSGLGAYEWCSNCDCGIDVREWHRNHYNYCPNCGSDNREVEK